MSQEYDLYLQNHRTQVSKAYTWLYSNLPHVVSPCADSEWGVDFNHERTKNNLDEYNAYDEYFYGNNRSFAVVQAFREAWLLHIHRNQHHWQHWVLLNDDLDLGIITLEMPYDHVIEMICDWWSFGWNKGNVFELFKWYEEHKNYIKLHERTRRIVEYILIQIREKLEEQQNDEKEDN